MDKQQDSLSYEAKLPSGSSGAGAVIRNGSITMRKRTTFGGMAWKPRRLELENQTLTIINPVNNKRTSIELRDITELERTDLSDHCLRLKGRGKLYNFSFSSDPELYEWQDDIYQRCPLGNYSAPFDFVHKSHIGTDNVTGTFTDPNILPIYAEIVSGQPTVSKTATGVVATPRSRPTSVVLPLNAKPIQKVSPLPSAPGSPLLEGPYVVKHTRFFASWVWRDRWLSVTPQSLVIHRKNIQNSPASKNIPLVNLTRMEPDEKREGCLIVEYSSHRQTPPRSPSASSAVATPAKDTLWIIFKSYDELYTWRDALYDRSSLSSPIGNPTGFVHNTHVGFDADTGAFTGLPSQWQALSPSSSKPVARAAPPPRSRKLRRSTKRKTPRAL